MVATAEKYANEVYETNVGGTKLVIDRSLAAGVNKIIYVSSVSALFNVGDTVMNEKSAVSTGKNLCMASSYFICKIKGIHQPDGHGPILAIWSS
jgi:nucleoside-diphosphate-sugar epimerase